MDVLQQLFSTFKVKAEVFFNGQYCGKWAVDTSGTQYMNFHVVTHGQCQLSLQPYSEDVISLNTGDIVLFPRDMSHYLCNNVSDGQTVNISPSIPFTGGEGLDKDATGLVCGYFSHNHPQITQLTADLPEYIVFRHDQTSTDILSSLLHVLVKESLTSKDGSTYILNKLSECALAMLFREYLPVATGLLAALTHPHIRLALEAIHGAADKKWSVKELSELTYMSRASFASLFKALVGVSPIEYLTQWRLSLAFRLLADEQQPVLAVALQSGYDNESSFSKAFKRVMGKTPGEVRAGDV